MAIGGIGGALLAGLEGYSQARQREQNDQRLRADIEMRQRAFAADLQRQQQEQQAIGGAYAGLAGLGGLAPSMAPPQGPPDQLMSGSSTPPMNLPQVPAYAPMPRTMQDFGPAGRPSPIGQDVGGGMRAGGALTGGIPARDTPERQRLVDNIIRRESGGRNIMQQLVPESVSTASGLGQITNSTLRDIQRADPQTAGYRRAMDMPEKLQRQAIDDLIDMRGVQPWKTNTALMRDLGVMQRDPEFRQGVTQVQQSIPPMAQGRLGIVQMRDAIERAMPGADNATKGAALLQLQHMLAPDQKLQLEQAIRQHNEDFKREEFAETKRHHEALEAAGGERGWTTGEVKTEDGKTIPVRIQPSTGKVEPLQLPSGGVGLSKTGTKEAANVTLTPDAIEMKAKQALAGDPSAKTGMGYGNVGATNRAAVENKMAEIAKAEGISGEELAARHAEFSGTMAGERVLGGRVANLGLAAGEAEVFAPIAKDLNHKVDRTEYKDINRILLAGEERTGSPDVIRLGVALNAVSSAYAQVRVRQGASTDTARREAAELLQQGWSKDQLDAAIDQMMVEVTQAQKAPAIVRRQLREGIGAKSAPTQGAPAAPAGGTIKLDADGNVIQ